jgi:hypothetical protein
VIDQTVVAEVSAAPHRDAMRLARVAGVLYLPMFVLGPFSLFYVRATLMVPGDAAATADRIAAHDGLLRASSVIELYLALSDVALAALFYLLARPVSRPLALVSAFFRLTWAAVGAIAVLTNVVALLIVRAGQPPAAALLSMDLHKYVFAIGFVAFGTHLVIFGYLIWTSNLLPRAVGIALMVAGACYVANSLLTLGWGPPSQPLLLLPAFPAELALCLSLLIKGVRPWPPIKEISS